MNPLKRFLSHARVQRDADGCLWAAPPGLQGLWLALKVWCWRSTDRWWPFVLKRTYRRRLAVEHEVTQALAEHLRTKDLILSRLAESHEQLRCRNEYLQARLDAAHSHN